jgi:hypothetical protein
MAAPAIVVAEDTGTTHLVDINCVYPGLMIGIKCDPEDAIICPDNIFLGSPTCPECLLLHIVPVGKP